jgi:ATP-dependent Clp endopeptidase proteolytic subunit ClpP
MPKQIQVRAAGARRAEVLIHEAIGENWYGDGLTAKRFNRDLAALGELDEILVRINSPGGAVFDGVAIYNTLKGHKAKVDVLVEGLAASIASVIAMAGDTIRVGHGAMFMIHNPWTIAMGDADDMRETADMLDKVGESLIDIYHTRTGIDDKELRKLLDAETWLTASEAVAQGFADEIDEGAAPEEAATDAFRERVSALAKEFRQPADMNSLRAVAAVFQSATADKQRNRSNAMTPEEIAAAAAAEKKVKDDAAKAALAAENVRRTSIRAAFGKFADAHRALLDACLDDQSCTADTAKEKLLAKLGEGASSVAGGVVEVAADARDKFREGISAALEIRCGLQKRDPGNQFAGLTLAGMAAEALAIAGVNTRGLTNDGIARKIFATMTTSDLPQLLSVTAGKVLRAAYGNFPNTWNIWAAKGQVSDFKSHPRIQLGSFNALDTIAEGGEYTYGSLAESYENAQAVTKGKALQLTRQMIVNDDLGGFQRRAALMGRAAARTLNSDAYAYLTSGSSNLGPTSTDTGQYFNATAVTTAGGHANYTSSGTAISIASLGVGRVAMRKQKDAGLKETLNIEPGVLLTSVAKEDLARQIITSETDPASSNARVPNIYRNRFTVVSDPYLDSIAANPWFLFANPADVAAFEVVFLDGIEEPYVDEAIDWDTDSMKFKVRMDYGIAIGDWRAAYKNAGA